MPQTTKKASSKVSKPTEKKTRPKATKKKEQSTPTSKTSSRNGGTGENHETTLNSLLEQPATQEKLRELVLLAKEQGHLTFDDLNEVYAGVEVSPAEIDALIVRLRSME